jgi:hypothetical protein
MAANDGSVISTTKIVNNKSNDTGWNLVILSEGFQQGQLPAFEQAARDFANTMQATAPFNEVWSEINVFRINVASTDSGADDPVACGGGTGATPRTFFDASFCSNGIRRLLVVDSGLALRIAEENVSAAHMVVVIVNSPVYGGSGGSVAVCSLAADADEIALHEMGHTAFGLADEYSSYVGCGAAGDTNNNYPASALLELTQPNVTNNTVRQTLKWRNFVDPATPIPTTANADCTRCDPQGNPVAGNAVGLFEGGKYFHCGIYRPQFDCRMRNLGQPFCAVCQQVIRENFQCWLAIFDCIEEREEGYERCAAEEDHGYSACTQQRDEGYSDCCDWWPCSWACDAWVWISNIVCVAWTWISNIVCVAWTWVSSIICVAWRKLQC